MQTFEAKKNGWTSIVEISKNWLGESLRRLLLLPAIELYTPLSVRGRENLVGSGPFIFAPNHSSHLDTPLLLAALPLPLRLQTRVAAAYDYFFTSFWKRILFSTLVNAFPFVRKRSGSTDSLQLAQNLLETHHSLVIYPEGTRTPDGTIQSFKPGIGKLALNSCMPIVPVWIDGTYSAMPKGSRWPHHQVVTITFGQPLTFAGQPSPAEIARYVEQQVRLLAAEPTHLRAA